MRVTEEWFSQHQATHHKWKQREVNALSRAGAGGGNAPGGLVPVETAARGALPKKPKVTIVQEHPLVGLCTALRLPVPETEFRFHPIRKWRFDYAWPNFLMALEVEGGVWQKGGSGHSHPLGIERDHEKYSEAAILGWRILHVAPEHLTTIGIDYLMRAFPR